MILRTLLASFCFFTLTSCAANSSLKTVDLRPIEKYQTFQFSSDFTAVREAVYKVLETREYEVLEEDDLQISALKADVTSVEILTYSLERLKVAQSVFSGEIKLVIDYLEAPSGGTYLNIKANIQGVVGRSSLFKNEEWKGQMVSFTSRGDLENNLLQDIARTLKEKRSLQILISREVELQGGYTLK